MERRVLVSALSGQLLAARERPGFWRVGVDGVDGAGKTHLADELANELERRGVATVRVSLDGFHNPRGYRYRQGRESPEGFFRDSYDYDQFLSLVLEPLSPAGNGRYIPAIYDVKAERPVARSSLQAPADSVVIVDGIFLHRQELLSCWDFSIWLEVPFEVSIPRGAARGHAFGSADPAAATNRRYVEGQRLYIAECLPADKATVVVDNRRLASPIFVRRR